MPFRTSLLLLGVMLALLPWPTGKPACGDERQVEREFFEARIRPVLVEYCYECHNDQQREGGLALDSRAGVQAGGDRQKELAGDAKQRNLILEAIRHDHDDLKMPEGGAKLSPQTIADFEKWFASGAFDPRDAPPAPQELQPERLRELVFDQRAKWWALQPLSPSAPPVRDEPGWPTHPVDRFVFAAIREHGLRESPLATPEQLLRRVSFALVGLPPQACDLAQLGSDRVATEPVAQNSERGGLSPAVVDRLLASPQFGERWARHWMDWIRYSESHGSEGDPAIPYAYQYRDYLIRALNADVPYDRLVVEHLAGDLLETPRLNAELGLNESAIGPAHLRMVFHGFAPTDALEEKVRFVDDQIAAVSKAFLGLTVACARCHDHKFDAIRQDDYYALFGVLGSAHPGIVDANTPERQQAGQAELARLKPLIRQQVAARWLARVDSVVDTLLAPKGDVEKAIRAANAPTQTLYLWKVLLESAAAQHPDQPLPEAALQLLGDYSAHALGANAARPAAPAAASPTGSSGEASPQAKMKIESWFAHGNGTCQPSAPAGEFTLAADGVRGLDAILPSGHYSHLLSTRHRNVMLSPRIDLDQEYELWLLVAGEGGASVRYAVQDYPRDGTVYPVTALNDRQWRWQKYDLGYWQGDSVHVELATAGDAPVLVRPGERSWFGIRDARLLPKGQPAPPTVDFESFAAVAQAYRAAQPQTFAEFRACLAEALQGAITAWRDGTATDAQALWLDDWLQAGVLPAQTLPDDAAPQSTAEAGEYISPAAGENANAISRLLKDYRQLEAQVPLPTRVPGVLETRGADQALYVRGDHRQPSHRVARGFIRVLDPEPITSPASGRLALARKLTGSGRALLARVVVNRLWHHLFGRGLVATPDNFGKLGELPSHPELLDYLAQELIDNGWSLKHIIRLIVTSHTWQQTSQGDPAARELDPDNVWLARAPLRRLEAEAIRDAQLVAAGRFDAAMYGPSVDGGSPRRSLYVRVFRNSLEPQLRAFDFPEPTSTIGRRDVTNVPAQSLLLLNNPRVRAYARSWAEDTLARHGQASSDTSDAIVSDLFRAAFWRAAESAEVADVLTLERQLREELSQRQSLRDQLVQKIAANRQAQEQLLAPTRKQILTQLGGTAATEPGPAPLTSWEFDTLADSSGKVAGELVGQAELVAGGLVTRGGFFKSFPLPYKLKAKTLEAWIVIDDLKQRGGGVMSLQTLGGDVFDSVVLGEQREGEWLAGSNNFARTKPFGGPVETETSRAIHLAITYAADGRVTGYRNGEPYGQSYMSGGLQAFDADQSVITFGCRHLPAGGNKQLSARWERARLYDRALSAAEVAASYRSQPHVPTTAEIVAALNPDEQATFETLQSDASGLASEQAAIGEASSDPLELQVWTEIALALMNAKEFIFVK